MSIPSTIELSFSERLALLTLRIAAYLADALLVGMAGAVLYVPFAIARTPSPGVAIAIAVVAVAIGLAYAIAFEGHRVGATPGKQMAQIRVVDSLTAGRIGYRRAAVRAVVRPVSSLFGLGLLWGLFDSRARTWHDLVSGSVVIREPPGRATM